MKLGSNAQMVQNSTGTMGRLQRINIDDRTVDIIMLDGFQAGEEYFYHIVTDVSAELPAALENGYVAPRLRIFQVSALVDQRQRQPFWPSP